MTYNPDRMTSIQILDGKLSAAGAADERIEMAAIDLSNIQRTLNDYVTEMQALRLHLAHATEARRHPRSLDDEHWEYLVLVLEAHFQEVLEFNANDPVLTNSKRMRLKMLRHFADGHPDASLLMTYSMSEQHIEGVADAINDIGYGIWKDVFHV